MISKKAIKVDKNDNVAIALQNIKRGEKVIVVCIKNIKNIKYIKARSSIPLGHKLALSRIKKGEIILKYGEVIGRATTNIEPGEHVHVHNVESLRGRELKEGS